MRTASDVGKLANAGLDLKVAQAHGEAIDELLADATVTRDFLEARLSKEIGDLKAAVYQAMFVQAIGTVGLTVALLKPLP